MEAESITQTLALWGAVTGVIGIIAGIANLVPKKQKIDRPNLSHSLTLSVKHSPDATHSMHKLTLSSVGEPPVAIDYVRYFIKPKGFWQSLLRHREWYKNRWTYDYQPTSTIEITQGKKEELSILIPDGLSILDVAKVEIRDQSGYTWSVKWPSIKNLGIEERDEQLHESEESNTERLCKVSGYTASGKYHIYAYWNLTARNKACTKGRCFCFKNQNDYQAKLRDILDVQQPRILSCELDEIV